MRPVFVLIVYLAVPGLLPALVAARRSPVVIFLAPLIGAAMAAMRVSTYRKLRPGRVEEFVFYDHPSGYERVHRAMTWLRENQAIVTAADTDR